MCVCLCLYLHLPWVYDENNEKYKEKTTNLASTEKK